MNHDILYTYVDNEKLMSQRQWELQVIPLDYKTDLTQEDIIFSWHWITVIEGFSSNVFTSGSYSETTWLIEEGKNLLVDISKNWFTIVLHCGKMTNIEKKDIRRYWKISINESRAIQKIWRYAPPKWY